jgi:hypothetical protein
MARNRAQRRLSFEHIDERLGRNQANSRVDRGDQMTWGQCAIRSVLVSAALLEVIACSAQGDYEYSDKHLLYVHFDGLSPHACDADDHKTNCSKVLDARGVASTTVPPFDHARFDQLRDRTREDVMAAIRAKVPAYFDGLNVSVVLTRPDPHS